MAEQTSQPSSQPSNNPQTDKTQVAPTGPVKGQATILATTEDGVLQPDSMRGTEGYLKDLDVVDLEQDRRDEQNKDRKTDK